jgi:hypothetical protein
MVMRCIAAPDLNPLHILLMSHSTHLGYTSAQSLAILHGEVALSLQVLLYIVHIMKSEKVFY